MGDSLPATHDVLPQRSRERRHKRKAGAESSEPEPQPDTPAPVAEMRVRGAGIEGGGCEFLDHTADVQLHSWGPDLIQTLEWQVLGMFDYMTDRSKVDPARHITVRVEDAHDLGSLLYKLMDEFLFHFSAEFFTLHEVRITNLDTTNWSIDATAWGETWDRSKHPCGTEVKAITFQCLRILSPGEDTVDPEEQEGRVCVPDALWNAYVIIDI
eukprot:TRINITY_DN47278_c0_g1_i1.p1 TRINITY_DN47278_c0_g1~~TRINITY_DN47278_c0_g1_i1.p1  ORF type:complete len:212 (+),score=69.35 TRINITY_DN47278_c0_g1_i1:66-701(+)